MEQTERLYHLRRAHQEKGAAASASCLVARDRHLELAAMHQLHFDATTQDRQQDAVLPFAQVA
jgi:hypothetical protein